MRIERVAIKLRNAFHTQALSKLVRKLLRHYFLIIESIFLIIIFKLDKK